MSVKGRRIRVSVIQLRPIADFLNETPEHTLYRIWKGFVRIRYHHVLEKHSNNQAGKL